MVWILFTITILTSSLNVLPPDPIQVPELRRTKVLDLSDSIFMHAKKFDREEGFEEMLSRIERMRAEKGKLPICYGLVGETGAGQTTIAKLYVKWLRLEGIKAIVISGDNFIIPKPLRTPEGSSSPQWKIDLSEQDEVEIGVLGIKVKRIDEGVIQVSTPTFSTVIEFSKDTIPIWRLNNTIDTEIEI